MSYSEVNEMCWVSQEQASGYESGGSAGARQTRARENGGAPLHRWSAMNLISKPRAAAQARARELLRSLLTEREFTQLTSQGYLEMRSQSNERRVYRIPRGPGMVRVFDGGEAVWDLCLQPAEPLPADDIVLMHKLLLESDEQGYWEKANRFLPFSITIPDPLAGLFYPHRTPPPTPPQPRRPAPRPTPRRVAPRPTPPPPGVPSHLDFRRAHLDGGRFCRAELAGADFSGAHLAGADLRWADLERANLRGADLRGADLFGARLAGASLAEADLRRADLRQADLHATNLRAALICRALIVDALLIEADLSGADVRGLRLGEAQMERCQLTDVRGDGETTWPTDFDSQQPLPVRL